MKLTYEGLKDRTVWAAAGIDLPDYDPEAVSLRTREHPVWVHLGIGNIFRFFLGGIADRLLRENLTDRGITCVETFDYEIVDRIYQPFDNLALAVTLYKDGSQKRRVLGSLSEALALRPGDKEARDRLTQIFTDPGLQMVSFTITEKGYALHGADGGWLAPALKDAQEGPEKAGTAMGLVTAMLAERWKAGKAPLALVSMDNVSQNGKKLRESVLELAGCWVEQGFVPTGFLDWVSDEACVSFPWSMIDKITPRPVESVAAALKAAGVEDMDILVTNRQTWIAPFVNAEEPQYLVVEDRFPNGRPPLEKAGVYMTDRVTVNKSERMKVTACLNPIHTAVCTFDRLLGYELFADGMSDPELNALACKVGYDEGLPVVESPGILDPKAFLDEVLTQRFPNAGLGDTSARIAVDISQMLAIRFGETIKATQAAYGSADRLVGIPLAIAGWIRYLLAVDDTGAPFELSPDPMLPQLKEQLSTLCWNDPESLTGQLQPILSNERLFGVDLYAIGLGDRIESMVRSMLSGPGAVRSTLQAHLSK